MADLNLPPQWDMDANGVSQISPSWLRIVLCTIPEIIKLFPSQEFSVNTSVVEVLLVKSSVLESQIWKSNPTSKHSFSNG